MAVGLTVGIGAAGVIIVLGLITIQVAKRLKISNVLLLILIGFVLGTPVLNLFDPLQFQSIVQGLVLFTLIVVLFDSGYDIRIKALLAEIQHIIKLTFLALVPSIIIAALISMYIFKFSWQTSLLIGAIVSSTDITVIAPLLESLKIKQTLKDLLSTEAAINSVISIIVATIVVTFLIPGGTEGLLLLISRTFMVQILVGISLGLLFGYALIFILKNLRVEQRPEILSIGAILLIYAIAESVDASGIFAVFVTAMVLGNAKPSLARILEFESNVALLLTIFVFVVFGALLNPERMLEASAFGILLTIGMVVARLPAVYTHKRAGFDKESRTLLLMGPRGMTGVVLTLLYMNYFEKPGLALGAIFIVVLATIALSSFEPYVTKRGRGKKTGRTKKAKSK